MNPATKWWPALLRSAGILLLIAGLQAWGYYRQASPLIEEAQQQLNLLQHEVPKNRLLNSAMHSLQEFWQATDDELTRRQDACSGDHARRGPRPAPTAGSS